MAERVDKLLADATLAKPLLSTFHCFCVRVLRRDIEALRIGDKGLTRSFAIYDESDQQAVVKTGDEALGARRQDADAAHRACRRSAGRRTT